ncbi:MAG TPA: hypothetical protein VM120_26290 [Bryobacteraceae bacterium]|nr:hypothetical protein [Bryobacteraceae bacterium]
MTPYAGMHDHRELLTVIGEVVHAVLNIDPRSPQASQAVQAIRSSAKAITKGGSAGF